MGKSPGGSQKDRMCAPRRLGVAGAFKKIFVKHACYTGIGATTWEEANIQATMAAHTTAPR